MGERLERRGSVNCGFLTVAAEFETLKREFANCVDWSLRQCLLQEMQSKLNQADLLMECAYKRLRLPLRSSTR